MALQRVIKCLLCVFILKLNAFAQSNLDFKPLWHAGQRWKIEVEKMSGSLDPKPEGWRPKLLKSVYEFEVEGNIEVDGEQCISIITRQVSFNGKLSSQRRQYRLIMRTSDLSIKECRKIFIKPEKVIVIRTYADSGAVDLGLESQLLVLPVFEDESIQNETDRKERYSKAVNRSEFRFCRQQEAFKKFLTHDGAEVEALLFTFENVNMPKKATQLWIKGMPWWSESTYFSDGNLLASARLIEPVEEAETSVKEIGNRLKLPERTQAVICEEFWKKEE